MMVSSLKGIAMFSNVSGCLLTDCCDPAITIYAVGLQVNPMFKHAVSYQFVLWQGKEDT